MTKFYRTTCFREIGGFVREVMWDGIDCHRCRMLGWKPRAWTTRSCASFTCDRWDRASKSIWTGRVRSGYGQYYLGTGPLYLAAVAAFRLLKHPVVYGSVAILWGYLSSAARRLPRYDDPEFRRFLRRYQRACLLHGKREATRRLNEAQAAVWRDAHDGQASRKESLGTDRRD